MTRSLGIDPGLSGALVILEDDQPIEWMRMPVYLVGKNKRINGSALAAFIGHMIIDQAYVEQVGAMPGQGVSSMFTFGHATGTVMGVLAALEIPVINVLPGTWKKRSGIIGKDKDGSRSKAIQLWPAWRELDKKGAGQAYADAAMIARYGHE
jgi:crossover junction endodeoxyribonuclease RuvC